MSQPKIAKNAKPMMWFVFIKVSSIHIASLETSLTISSPPAVLGRS
jgi:hypothetical protein